MVTLARMLARHPKVLFFTGLSLELAPLVVDRLLRALAEAVKGGGIAVMLVEQHARMAIAVADHVMVMRGGRGGLEGTGENLHGPFGEIRTYCLAGSAPEAV